VGEYLPSRHNTWFHPQQQKEKQTNKNKNKKTPHLFKSGEKCAFAKQQSLPLSVSFLPRRPPSCCTDPRPQWKCRVCVRVRCSVGYFLTASPGCHGAMPPYRPQPLPSHPGLRAAQAPSAGSIAFLQDLPLASQYPVAEVTPHHAW
jgi:hypothetical protein